MSMSNAQDYHGTITALDALFAPWNRSDQPGLVVGVRRKGRFLYRRAFGMASLEAAVANSVNTRMRIGSTSKHFLAVLALQLQEEGLFDLDAPIGTYLPELTPPNSEPTVRQLLQHRGGTRCHIDLAFIGHGLLAAPTGSALQTLQAQDGRNFPPGDAMIYNNGGYHLVSLAVSRLAGAPLAEVLKRRLFDPLRMSDTALVLSDYVMTPGIASFHLPSAEGWRRGLFLSHEILGEGGIVSTIDDMMKWADHLQSRVPGSGETILNALIDAPAERDGSSGYYGLGLMTRSYRGMAVLNHPGSVIGGSSDFVCVPDQALEIVIMSNGAPGAVPPLLSNRVMDIVLDEQLASAPLPVDPTGHHEWLGHYGSRKTGMVYGLQVLNDVLCLRVAQYAVPDPLDRCAENWLSTGLNGLGTISVHCDRLDDGTASLRVRFSGREEVLERISSAENLQVSGPDGVEAAYESPESGLSATITRRQGQLILDMRDRWGVAEFDLCPLGGEWLEMRSHPDPDQFGAILWFPDGWEAGFTLNSARTRNLHFRRLEERNEP